MKICVTGAAGNIGQILIPMLCNGSIFPNIKITLSLLDINNEPQIKAMNGIKIELHDCNFPLLEDVLVYTDAKEAFKDCDVIVFLGGYPRKPGMERRDLLQINGKIFTGQAEALAGAKPNVKCLVVANPCNTNAKILYKKIQEFKIPINKENITCLSRLDQNRANSIYKENYTGKEANMFIWGNHSTSCVPDSMDQEVTVDLAFMEKVQKRGAEIINVKGTSSSFSAAKAIADHLYDWYHGSNKIVSMGVISNGEYGIKEGLVCSFPTKCTGDWKYEIIKDIQISDEKKKLIFISVKELEDEEKEISDI